MDNSIQAHQKELCNKLWAMANALRGNMEAYEAGKNQNILRESDIDRIVEAYERREDVDKYAHVATMQEIEENGFNLNIPRYVDTFEPEEEIDLNEVAAEIRKLQTEIKGIDAELKPFFDELGLDFPFDVEGE